MYLLVLSLKKIDNICFFNCSFSICVRLLYLFCQNYDQTSAVKYLINRYKLSIDINNNNQNECVRCQILLTKDYI